MKKERWRWAKPKPKGAWWHIWWGRKKANLHAFFHLEWFSHNLYAFRFTIFLISAAFQSAILLLLPYKILKCTIIYAVFKYLKNQLMKCLKNPWSISSSESHFTIQKPSFSWPLKVKLLLVWLWLQRLSKVYLWKGSTIIFLSRFKRKIPDQSYENYCASNHSRIASLYFLFN